MELQETIDIKYDQIEGQKQKLSEDHYMNPEREDELEELIASAIKFGELCAQRDLATPEGFVLVPKEPTEDMTIYAIDNCEYDLEQSVMASIYKDMLEAAQEQSHE